MQLDKQEANKLKKMASFASIGTAMLLSLLKVAASIHTGSLAVISSMIDSVSDVLASLVTFIAVKFSARAATENYRYGYGKAESLSALFQSLFVACSGLFVMYDGIMRFLNPRPVGQTEVGIIIMLVSLVSTFCLIAFQKYVVRKTNSEAIKADSAHYVVDILTNSSIILTLIVVKFFGWIWFDTLVALFITIFLLYNAYELARDAISNLLDRELGESIRNEVKKIVTQCNFVKGMHDLRTRDTGGTYIFEFHLELDGDWTLQKVHECSHCVEDEIKKKFPNSQVIIHQEPAGLEEDRLDDKLKCQL